MSSKRTRIPKKNEMVPGSLRTFNLGEGLPSLSQLRDELQNMVDVLMGRKRAPVNANRTEAMMEVADAYFARASEIMMMLQKLEADGRIRKGSHHYKFRTGELRTFMEMAKRTADMGSRRITVKQLQFDQERYGKEMY